MDLNTITIQNFKDRFYRDFTFKTAEIGAIALQADPDFVQDRDINNAFMDAQELLNQGLFPDNGAITLGYLLLTAHCLCLQTSITAYQCGFWCATAATCPVNSRSVGSVSESYSIPENYLKRPTIAALYRDSIRAEISRDGATGDNRKYDQRLRKNSPMNQSKITHNMKGLEDFVAFMKDHRARVGVLGDKAQRDDDSPLNNAEIGFVNFTGSITKNIPARDFLIFPLEYKKREISKQLTGQQVKAALGAGNRLLVFKLLGIIAEGISKESFESSGYGQWARNAPLTIAIKGFDKPLIHHDELRRAIGSDVAKKGDIE